MTEAPQTPGDAVRVLRTEAGLTIDQVARRPLHRVNTMTQLKISLTADQACEATGIGKSTLYAAARRGDLEVRWVGRQKFVVEPEELRAWVRTLPTVKPGGAS